MKKYIIFIVFVLLVYSCEDKKSLFNSNIDLKSSNLKNEVVFENSSLKNNKSPYFYDNHFYLIEKLKNSREIEEIKSVIHKNSINTDLLNENEILKYYVNNSDATFFSVKYKNADKKLIIIFYEGEYLLTKADFFNIPGNKKQFYLKSLSDKIFYSVQINHENKFGEIHFERISEIEDFNQRVYKIKKNNSILKSAPLPGDEECCKKKLYYSDCLDCTVEECGRQFWCVAMCIAEPEGCLIAWILSCIGCGPDANC